MKNNTIITISRQYGSGGRLIGQKLAERLGIPFYDKELITLAAEESGFAEHLFEKNDRNITNSLLYSLSMYGNTMGLYDMPLNDKLFIAQSKTIQSVAEKGPCVIVGRCADYVLRDDPNVALVNLFVHAPMDARIRRESARTNTTPAEAEKRIRQVDKERAAYYNFFSSKRWGDAQAYDLCVNTDGLEISDVVQLVLRYLELRGLR